MKRLATLLLLLISLTALLCAPALAEPRYPESGGVVTDAAAVLSASTVEDLRAFSEQLRKKADMPLRVATVDFLDGASLADYGEELFDPLGYGRRGAAPPAVRRRRPLRLLPRGGRRAVRRRAEQAAQRLF